MWCCRPYEYPGFAQEAAAADNFYEQAGYDLSSPSAKYLLPGILAEISGLSFYRRNVLACVQDELGTVFFYSLKSNEIIDRLKFAGNGDYEGLAVVDRAIYVVKSNGDIFEYAIKEDSTTKIKTPLSGNNDVEGLAYDPQNNRLLIACKGAAELKGEESKKGKAVYAFDLEGRFDRDPFLLLGKDHLQSWNDRQPVPLELTKKIKGFKPSGLAVHPKSNHIFIIASDGKVLMVTDEKGNLLQLVPLSPRIFKQPEGICFAPNGDLYISNEARGGVANILEFKYLK